MGAVSPEYTSDDKMWFFVRGAANISVPEETSGNLFSQDLSKGVTRACRTIFAYDIYRLYELYSRITYIGRKTQIHDTATTHNDYAPDLFSIDEDDDLRITYDPLRPVSKGLLRSIMAMHASIFSDPNVANGILRKAFADGGGAIYPGEMTSGNITLTMTEIETFVEGASTGKKLTSEEGEGDHGLESTTCGYATPLVVVTTGKKSTRTLTRNEVGEDGSVDRRTVDRKIPPWIISGAAAGGGEDRRIKTLESADGSSYTALVAKNEYPEFSERAQFGLIGVYWAVVSNSTPTTRPGHPSKLDLEAMRKWVQSVNFMPRKTWIDDQVDSGAPFVLAIGDPYGSTTELAFVRSGAKQATDVDPGRPDDLWSVIGVTGNAYAPVADCASEELRNEIRATACGPILPPYLPVRPLRSGVGPDPGTEQPVRRYGSMVDCDGESQPDPWEDTAIMIAGCLKNPAVAYYGVPELIPMDVLCLSTVNMLADHLHLFDTFTWSAYHAIASVDIEQTFSITKHHEIITKTREFTDRLDASRNTKERTLSDSMYDKFTHELSLSIGAAEMSLTDDAFGRIAGDSTGTYSLTNADNVVAWGGAPFYGGREGPGEEWETFGRAEFIGFSVDCGNFEPEWSESTDDTTDRTNVFLGRKNVDTTTSSSESTTHMSNESSVAGLKYEITGLCLTASNFVGTSMNSEGHKKVTEEYRYAYQKDDEDPKIDSDSFVADECDLNLTTSITCKPIFSGRMAALVTGNKCLLVVKGFGTDVKDPAVSIETNTERSGSEFSDKGNFGPGYRPPTSGFTETEISVRGTVSSGMLVSVMDAGEMNLQTGEIEDLSGVNRMARKILDRVEGSECRPSILYKPDETKFVSGGKTDSSAVSNNSVFAGGEQSYSCSADTELKGTKVAAMTVPAGLAVCGCNVIYTVNIWA